MYQIHPRLPRMHGSDRMGKAERVRERDGDGDMRGSIYTLLKFTKTQTVITWPCRNTHSIIENNIL